MTGYEKFNFKGIIATAFTPFKDDSERSLNLSVIPQYAEYYESKGFEAVLINGTYGEGMSMSTDERIEVANAWADAVKKTNQQLIIQVGGTNLPDVKKLARHAQEIKANAILCLPELYYKPKTAEALIDYLKEVGKAAPEIPLLYYYSPDATGVTVNIIELLEKVEDKIPSFAGVKYASSNAEDCSKVMHSDTPFKIVLANNYFLPVAVALKIKAFMPTSINVAPELVQKIIKLAGEGEFFKAQELQVELAKIVDRLAKINNGVPLSTMKYVTSRLIPIDVGPTRKPLRGFDTKEEELKIANLVKELF